VNKKGSVLDRVTTEIVARPSAMLIMGPPGIGKSTLAGNIPNIIVQPFGQEDTWSLLKQSSAVPVDLPVLPRATKWLDLMINLEALRTEDHPYRGVAIDTATCAEALCHEHVTDSQFGGSWDAFMAYHRGYEVALGTWTDLTAKLDALRDERGMSVVLLGHTKVAPFKNPEGEDFDRFQPDLHKKTAAALTRWADAVLFATYYIEVEDGKGKGGKSRVMHTQWCPAWEAKNRLGLPPMIDMGESGAEAWGNLRTAIKGARTDAA